MGTALSAWNLHPPVGCSWLRRVQIPGSWQLPLEKMYLNSDHPLAETWMSEQRRSVGQTELSSVWCLRFCLCKCSLYHTGRCEVKLKLSSSSADPAQPWLPTKAWDILSAMMKQGEWKLAKLPWLLVHKCLNVAWTRLTFGLPCTTLTHTRKENHKLLTAGQLSVQTSFLSLCVRVCWLFLAVSAPLLLHGSLSLFWSPLRREVTTEAFAILADLLNTPSLLFSTALLNSL